MMTSCLQRHSPFCIIHQQVELLRVKSHTLSTKNIPRFAAKWKFKLRIGPSAKNIVCVKNGRNTLQLKAAGQIPRTATTQASLPHSRVPSASLKPITRTAWRNPAPLPRRLWPNPGGRPPKTSRHPGRYGRGHPQSRAAARSRSAPPLSQYDPPSRADRSNTSPSPRPTGLRFSAIISPGSLLPLTFQILISKNGPDSQESGPSCICKSRLFIPWDFPIPAAAEPFSG